MGNVYEQHMSCAGPQTSDHLIGFIGDSECLSENISNDAHTVTAVSRTQAVHKGVYGGRPTLERARYLRDIVRTRSPCGKPVWCNKRNNSWLDESSATWKSFSETNSDFDEPNNTGTVSSSTETSEAASVDYYSLTQRKKNAARRKSIFWTVRDSFVTRFQKRQDIMLKIHISHLDSFGQDDMRCYTTHIVPTHKLIGHLFILHAMDGGVAPRSDIALVQNGVMNERGEWVVLDTKAEPFSWDPVDETSVMNAGWYFCENELWLALIRT